MKILSLATLILFAGCAAQPEIPSAPAPEAAGLAAPDTAALAAPAVDQSSPATLSAAKPAEKPKAFKPPAGYKPRLQAGQVVYCTKIVVLGSRFPKDDCRTQSELEELTKRNRTMRGDLEQQRGICGSATGCGSN
jgi:hypothetical protein